MDTREAVARWLYNYVMEWMDSYYQAEQLGITPWEECALSIRESWYEKADELLSVVGSST